MTLGDRIAGMQAAEITQIAPPQTVYDKPVNKFVAGFIGSPQMNFFDGTVTQNGDDVVVTTEAFEFTLPETITDKIDRDISGSHDISFGIRPEDLHAQTIDDADPEAISTVESEVIVVEEMGSDFHLTLDSNGVEYQGIVEPDTTVARGDQLSVDFDLEKCHLFDQASGESLLYGDE